MHFDGPCLRFQKYPYSFLLVFSGLFKTKRDQNETLASDPPQFQMFQCLRAPSATDGGIDVGGRTLFTNTHLIHQELFQNDDMPFASDVNSRLWKVFTPINNSFGGEELKQPITVANPLTAHTILRWHERWYVELTSTTLGVSVSPMIMTCYTLQAATYYDFQTYRCTDRRINDK